MTQEVHYDDSIDTEPTSLGYDFNNLEADAFGVANDDGTMTYYDDLDSEKEHSGNRIM